MTFLFKENAKAEIGIEDPWYALTDGDYLKPESVLIDQAQIAQLNGGIKLVPQFIQQRYDEEVIEEA
jgi:hypothetical protein